MRVSLAAANAVWLLASVSVAGAASRIDDARELQRRGKLEAAHNLLSAAAVEYRVSGDRRNLALALGIAADISVSLGRYSAAIAEAGEALTLRAAVHDEARIGDDYNTIGLAYQYLGNYPAALDNYRRAFDSDRAGNDADGEITRLNNIGNVFYFQGRYSDALRAYEDAMQQVRATSAEPWNAAQREFTLANLAVLFQRLGQERRALDYYRQIADSRRLHSSGGMPLSEQAQLLLNRGVLYRRLGDPVKALATYRAAQSLFAADRHSDGEIGALRNIGIALAVDLNDLPHALDAFTRALELARQSRNRRATVQAGLYRGELLHQLNRNGEAEADLRAAFNGAQSAGLVEEQWRSLHALARIEEDTGRTVAAEQDYLRAVSIVESVRAALRLVSLRGDFLADKRDVYDSLIDLRLRDSSVTPAEIFNWMERSRARTLLDRLQARVALPEPRLAEVQSRLGPGTVMVEFWTGNQRAAALWITSSSAGLVRYGDAAGLRADRILKDIPPADHLIVLPDGALTAMPFETLRVPGSGAPLIEKCDVSYLPSARFLARKPRRKWLAPWATEIVALADPPAASNLLDESWQPLPASAEEVRAIAQLLPGRAQIHLGADARKSYLTGGAPSRVPLLHLATHAMIDAEDPDRSRILLAHDYLFEGEIYDLDFTGVDLVTLSACDTALGKFVRGDGAQAFSQAFLAAGATAVVTTLWRVADRPTAEFMKQFYYALAHGDSKAAALRSAKLRFIRSNSSLADPRYWAAFVLNGDGSAPVPRAVRWSTCLAAAALALAIAAAAIAGFRRSRRTV